MAVIAIYDSGIGGLTTLSYLLKTCPYHDYVYYADVENFPLGIKTHDVDADIESKIAELKDNADVVVAACYTASSIIKDESVIKLRPMLRGLDGKDTLLLATPKMLSSIYAPTFFRGHTPCLASYVQEYETIKVTGDSSQIEASRKKLGEYIKAALRPFIGVKNVVLACTHYSYCKKEISDVLGDVNFYDGNEAMKEKLLSLNLSDGDGTVRFYIEDDNLRLIYAKILESLLFDEN